jgi:hypothetical protein
MSCVTTSSGPPSRNRRCMQEPYGLELHMGLYDLSCQCVASPGRTARLEHAHTVPAVDGTGRYSASY